ncbi:MAG: hypothetical protein ACKPKO_61325, partial [Candidatus Fonsibacter sp.]
STGAITYQTAIVVVGHITSQGDISSVGSISVGTTLSAGGTISTVGNITASAGTITGRSLAVTGTTGRLQIPTAQGCYIGQASSGYTAIELVSGVGTTYQTYVDVTEPNVYFRGRIIYRNGTNDFQFCINSVSTVNITLNSSGLSVDGTFVSASDKSLKFNEKPSTNAFDVISRLDPI